MFGFLTELFSNAYFNISVEKAENLRYNINIYIFTEANYFGF